MAVVSQQRIALSILALQLTAVSALTVGPTLGRPLGSAGAIGADPLGDCLALVQMGSPRRGLAPAAVPSHVREVAAATSEVAPAQQEARRLAASAVAASAVAKADAVAVALPVQKESATQVVPVEPEENSPLPEAAAKDGFLAVEVAWSTVAKAGQAKHMAVLSVAVGFLIVALGFRLSRLRSQCQDKEAAPSVAMEPPETVDAEVPAETMKELEQPEAAELSEMPPPMRRLRFIGASYVVPRERIEGWGAETLNFDVPTLPCAWPLRAQLSRPSPMAPWARIQLTVDIISASGLPPLLTCTRTDAQTPPEESGGTGGTGSPTSEAAEAAAVSLVTDASWSSEEGEEGETCPWLKICNAGGTVVATICRRRHGSCLIQRQDRSVWDLVTDFDGTTPSITISKQGQEISQATCFRDQHLQIDTQPDLKSPESCVLLMCTLAVLAFRQ